MVLPIAWAVGIVTVSLAYWIAGPVWIERHSLRFKVGSQTHRTSGAVGEIAIITCAALLLYFIDGACPDVSLESLIATHPRIVLGGAIAIALIVTIYGVTTALSAAKHQRLRLLATYLVYDVYSTILFAGGVLMFAIILLQANSDAVAFGTATDRVISLISNLEGQSSETIQRNLELSNLEIEDLLARAQDSMSPVFVLLAGIFAINIAIRATPLRSLFMNDAVLITQITTLLGVGLVLLSGSLTYINYYSSVITRYNEALDGIRPFVASEDIGLLQRFSDIYLDKSAKQSMVGFITRMANEWGGLAAILGLAQWFSDQFHKKEAEESSANRPPEKDA